MSNVTSETLESMFRSFGKMYLEKASAQQRKMIIMYVRKYAMDNGGSDAREVSKEAEADLLDFWAEVDRQRITVSKGGADAIRECFEKDNGDSETRRNG